MKKADLEEAEIVTCISKGITALRGTNSEKGKTRSFRTLYDEYHIEYDPETKKYKDKGALIKYKTLERRLQDLIKEEIICEKGKRYRLNIEKVFDLKNLGEEERESIKSLLLECEDYDSYRVLRDRDNGTYYEEEDLQIIQKTVKNHCIRFKNNTDVLDRINGAMLEHKEIDIIYKGDVKSVFPLCYVINRKAIKCYLFCCQKKQIMAFDVSEIELPALSNIKKKDRILSEKVVDEKMDLIRKLWDVGISQTDGGDEVILRILKNQDGKAARDELENGNQGWTVTEEEDYFIYKGFVYGLSDFEKWVRSHIQSCIVVKPEQLQLNIMNALSRKIYRYMEG